MQADKHLSSGKMAENNYKLPAVVWVKVTDFMHGWIQRELGGGARIGNQRVVCIQDLDGAREILRMEADEMAMQHPVAVAMSATWKNCIEAGLDIDAETVGREYGVTRQSLNSFVPIECPRMCMTRNGVLRPWTPDVCLSQRQAFAVQQLLRRAFWDAVSDFDREYARKAGGRYPAVEMIEEFCAETQTPDIHVDAMRREWQRRTKRERDAAGRMQDCQSG